jgi:hypothetical protein
MSSSICPDEFAKYAPRWVREGTARPREVVRLPAAPQLAMVHPSEPSWQGPSPFAGDVRQWRAQQMPTQPGVRSPAIFVSDPVHVGFVERFLPTAALLSLAVIAGGVLSYALFSNASRAAFETHGKAILAAIVPEGAMISRHKLSLPAQPASRLGVSDSVPAPRAMESATRPSDNPPVEQAVISAPQGANAVYVVANVDRTAQPQVPREQPDHQQLQHPQVMQVHVQQVKVEQHDARIPSAEEINRLIHWGENFLAQGDVASARRFLERAAEARDPRATLMLGATYDPVGLKGMGVVGILPDLEQAHAWYMRAAEFGSREASQRLMTLAQLAR